MILWDLNVLILLELFVFESEMARIQNIVVVFFKKKLDVVKNDTIQCMGWIMGWMLRYTFMAIKKLMMYDIIVLQKLKLGKPYSQSIKQAYSTCLLSPFLPSLFQCFLFWMYFYYRQFLYKQLTIMSYSLFL